MYRGPISPEPRRGSAVRTRERSGSIHHAKGGRIARHTERENPSALLAEIFPGLSRSGRRRSNQPPCCEDASVPPMNVEVHGVLGSVFGL